MAAPHYPVLLCVEGRRALVVGGGAVAARKVEGLAECGAEVTVVAPRLCPAMEAIVSAGAARVTRRAFAPEDVEGAMVVVAATDDEDVNKQVAAEARARGAVVNVVDTPLLCDFIAPAVVRRGRLTVAVSTSGASPALAGRLARELAERFGPEWAEALERLASFRDQLLERMPSDPERRRDLLVAASRLDVAAIVAEEGGDGLEARLESLLGRREVEGAQ